MDTIDLHTHTTASDGSLTPAELVRAAKKAGLKALAITDHDTIDGLAEAGQAGRELGLEVIPGVEISVEGGFKGGIHMLGLWVDAKNQPLLDGLERLQQARADRNPRMIARLNELGIPITMEEVAGLAGGDLVGRPHFAQALVSRGVVKNRGEAFGRFLAAGKAAYVAKYRMPPEEALPLLRGAGALPILAHPGLLNISLIKLEALLRGLMDLGLEGVEAYYSEHDTAQQKSYVSLAARLNLAVSGGTDFHGAPKPDITLGQGKGGLRVPAALLPALKQRRDRMRAQGAGK